MKNIFLILTIVTLFFASCKQDDNSLVATGSTTLTGLNQVPTVTTGGTAVMSYAYNQRNRTFTYQVDYTNLSDSCTAIGIGKFLPGQLIPASGIYQLSSTFSTPVSLQRRTTGSYTGNFIVDGFSVTIDDIKAGKYCVFIRTKAYSTNGGEVRGQITL
jgi:hypothetical protein